MTTDALSRLEELARADPTVAPLARLQVEVLRVTDAVWEAGLPAFDDHGPADGLPLLHTRTLRVELQPVSALLARLADIAAQSGQHGAARSRQALDGGRLDLPALLEASIRQDADRLAELASSLDVDPGLLATLAGLATMPLLQACGNRAAPLLHGLVWDAGFCPLCAAWPALAELRGLERKRWLRCGRCSTGWERPGMRCPFCGNDDFRTLGYLAPEAAREARQAATCDACSDYLKTFTTLGPLTAAGIAVHDLTSLELDMAALEAGYARPERSGFPLDVHVTAAPAQPTSPRRGGWLRRGR